MTFGELQTELSIAVNRGPTDGEDYFKSAINQACEELNRENDFKHGFVQATYTYPASTASIAFSAISATHPVLSIHAAVLTATGTNVIRIVDWFALQRERRLLQQKESTGEISLLGRNAFLGFILGTNFGLFPAPATTTEISFTYKEILPKLVNTADVNYLLTYLPSLVKAKALVILAQNYLNSSELVSLFSASYQQTLASSQAWNNSIVLDELKAY